LVVNCFAGDTNITTKTYSQIKTNWVLVSNHTIEAETGWGTNAVKTTINTQDSFPTDIGAVISNNICDLYYHGQLVSSTILSSNNIGKIRITWKDIRVYRTNYMELQ
jgi:hypothetical protein